MKRQLSIPFNIERRPTSLKGRAKARREFLSLLTSRQRFCFHHLGRYTITAKSGVKYHVEPDLSWAHQWFYILLVPGDRYYFSLTARVPWGMSDAAAAFVNLASLHLILSSDDRYALSVANWAYYLDKTRWEKQGKPFPPVLTPKRHRYRRIFEWRPHFPSRNTSPRRGYFPQT